MKYLVTGGAGFIGSNLVDHLLGRGDEVVVFDNLSTGQKNNLEQAQTSDRFTLIEGDLLDTDALSRAVTSDIDFVFHLAANADIRFGLDHPDRDLKQNTIATFNVLEAMRSADVKRIAFSSTGSVYGEPKIHPTPEDAPFPIQTSLYAASKVAGEGLIQAYAAGYGFEGYIFRFVSIMGPRYSHGHVFDFYRQLSDNSGTLRVLGDGRQRKSYLHVNDCIEAMLLAITAQREPVNIFNLGTDDSCVLTDSIRWICSVTAACLAEAGFSVCGYDADSETIDSLKSGAATVFEPGLDALIAAGSERGNLTFTSDEADVADSNLIWITYDTPVNDKDEADVDLVVRSTVSLLRHAQAGAVVLISSQLPLGTTDRIAELVGRQDLHFAYSPENLRLGKALSVFRDPGRIVIGVDDARTHALLEPLLTKLCDTLIWMSVRSAEMSKHAINSFLAISVAFSNELARIAERQGANAFEVEEALKSEERIGPKAYVRPGEAFAGGTLARDLVFLSGLSDQTGANAKIISAALDSNSYHREWPLNTLKHSLSRLDVSKPVRICVLGLAYKPGTNTLRRSNAVALAKRCVEMGYSVVAHDPEVVSLGEHGTDLFTLEPELPRAVRQADAIVVMTPWEEYRQINPGQLAEWCEKDGAKTAVIDQYRLLSSCNDHPAFSYYTIGVPADDA
eukprot:s1_g779.t1